MHAQVCGELESGKARLDGEVLSLAQAMAAADARLLDAQQRLVAAEVRCGAAWGWGGARHQTAAVLEACMYDMPTYHVRHEPTQPAGHLAEYQVCERASS